MGLYTRKILVSLFLTLAGWVGTASPGDQFVWSGTAGDTGDCLTQGECWGNAWTHLCRDWSAVAGFTESTDIIYVRTTHSDTQTAACDIDGGDTPSTAATVFLTVTGADTGTTIGSLGTGADQNVTGTGRPVTLDGNIWTRGLDMDSDASIMDVGGDTGNEQIHMENGTLSMDGASSIMVIGDGSGTSHSITFQDMDVTFGHVDNEISFKRGLLLWEGGTFNQTASTVNLFGTGGPSLRRVQEVYIRGVDLSVQQGNIFEGDVATGMVEAHVENSEFHASHDFTNGAVGSAARYEKFNSTSGTDVDADLIVDIHDFFGNSTVDTGRSRTGGATYDGNGYSYSMDTGTGAGTKTSMFMPHRGPDIYFWLDGDGATAYTVKVQISSGATQTNAGIWLMCGVQDDDSTSSLWDIISTRAEILDTPTNLTSETETWTCSSDCTVDQSMSFTHTPDKPGLGMCTVFMGVDGERISLDPSVEITS